MSKNNSGIILLSVLWILAILSLLALSLSKGSSLDISLVKNSIGKMKAYAAARAGINYSINSLNKSSMTEIDKLFQCGFKLSKSQKPEDLFKGIQVDKDSHFDIGFSGTNYSLNPNTTWIYGIEDESGRININAIDAPNAVKVFSKLLQQFDVSEDTADDIAAAVEDWQSSNPQGTVKGAKDDYYMSLSTPYKCKNRSFDRVEELLFVRGMTKDLFVKIKDYITVFPKNSLGQLKINLYTAPDAVIRAVAQAQVGLSDDGEDIINWRKNYSSSSSDDSDEGSKNTKPGLVDSSGVTGPSTFYRIHSVGTDESTGMQCTITAVVSRPQQGQGDLSTVLWQRN